MMVAGAFSQVQTSLRWFIDNFGVIADWRATLLRIADFRAALIGYPPFSSGFRAPAAAPSTFPRPVLDADGKEERLMRN